MLGTQGPGLERRDRLIQVRFHAAVWQCRKRRHSMALALISSPCLRMVSALPGQESAGRYGTKALVGAMIVVMVDEVSDRCFRCAGREVGSLGGRWVLQGLLPTSDLTLCLRGPGGAGAMDMFHARSGKRVGQFRENVAAAITNGARSSCASMGSSLGSWRRWATVARLQPGATRASSSVSATSMACIGMQCFKGTMYRLRMSRIVLR